MADALSDKRPPGEPLAVRIGYEAMQGTGGIDRSSAAKRASTAKIGARGPGLVVVPVGALIPVSTWARRH